MVFIVQTSILQQCAENIKSLMEEVMTLEAEREVIESTLRENATDISEAEIFLMVATVVY